MTPTPENIALHTSAAAVLQRATGEMTTAATARMDATLPWFRGLGAEERSWVGLVARAGISGFVHWLRLTASASRSDAARAADQSRTAAAMFDAAPRALARAITLPQTVELVRATIGVVEEHLDHLLPDVQVDEIRLQILRYSREVAFAAAEVYARAAESRGAWDARLEALVLESLLRGDVDDDLIGRAAALGWTSTSDIVVMCGTAPTGTVEVSMDSMRRAAHTHNLEILSAVHGTTLIVVIGGITDLARTGRLITPHFADGPVVIGPRVDNLQAASMSAQIALRSLAAAAGWPDAPRPVYSEDLVPERILNGDQSAVNLVLHDIIEPLMAVDESYLETLGTYFDKGSSLEATSRALFVHTNTIRYRLKRISEITGRSVADPRDALVLRLALILSRLRSSSPSH